MITTTHNDRWTHRLGWGAGRAWRGYQHRERRAVDWLIAQGMPKSAATTLLWLIKLVVLGVLLYVAFWFALVLAFAVACAWVIRNGTIQEEPEPEWRIGLSGYGLYRGDVRIDPESPDDDD